MRRVVRLAPVVVVVVAVASIALALAACDSDVPGAVCNEPDCTADDRQAAFDRAIVELERDGTDVTPESAGDPVVYAALLDRVLSLTGGGGDDPAATGRYDPGHAYCGPEGLASVNPGECLNRVCASHDRCYGEIEDNPLACAWSSRTTYCDDGFFAGYGSCARQPGQCGARCHAVAVIALGLRTLCINPLLSGRPAIALACAVRGVACRGCTGLDAEALCDGRPAACTTITDGCGRPQDCGACPAGQHCIEDGAEQSSSCTTCPGAPACSGHGSCSVDTRACTCNAGWQGADCATPVAPTPCGNGTCGAGETCVNCPADCGVCPPCGNGVCEANETCGGCPGDCGACPTCGNGVCEGNETCGGCMQDCGVCPTCAGCVDADHDGHYPTFCADATCPSRDDCDDDIAAVHPGAAEACDGLDNDCDVVIDDAAACWVPFYRFWDATAPLSARPRCFANTTSPPVDCAGYGLEFPGPVFFGYAVPAPATVAFVAYDKNNGADHLLVRAGTAEATALSGPGSGWHLRGTLGYLWADPASAPPGQFYRPAGAGSATVRDLRRYASPGGAVHLFANNPAETAPGWTFEGVRAWVWASRW